MGLGRLLAASDTGEGGTFGFLQGSVISDNGKSIQ